MKRIKENMSFEKLSHAGTVGVAAMICILFCLLAATLAAQTTPIGPGVAGQIHALAYDPANPDTVYAGGDVSGVFRSLDHGTSWELWNEGLVDANMANAGYVDDLIVVKQSAGVDAGRAGVYAATWGGIYYRDSGPWALLTDVAVYSHRGGVWRDDPVLGRVENDQASEFWGRPINFCSFGVDLIPHDTSLKQYLYAGAGIGRANDGWRDSGLEIYPNISLFPYSPIGTNPWNDQHSLWRLDLSSGTSEWEPVANSNGQTLNEGMVRQIAVREINGESYIAFASDKGVFVNKANDIGTSDWVNLGDNVFFADKSALGFSDEPWGVAWGYDTVSPYLYAVLGEDVIAGKPKGVYKIQIVVSGSNYSFLLWEAVGDSSQIVKPHDTSFGLGYPELSWGDIIAQPISHFSTITVKPNSNGCDEVFVGEFRDDRPGGVYRFSSSNTDCSSPEWVNQIYVNPFSDYATNSFSYHYLQPDGSGGYTQQDIDVGWMDNHGIPLTVPLVWHPTDPQRMIAYTYHSPIKTDNDGQTWAQFYSSDVGAGWVGTGIGEMVATDLDFFEDGRLLAGCQDFGAFLAANSSNTGFDWLSWDHASPRDIEEVDVRHLAGQDDEVFVRGHDSVGGYPILEFSEASVIAQRISPSTVEGTGLWNYDIMDLIYGHFAGVPFRVDAMDFFDENTLYVAANYKDGTRKAKVFKLVHDGSQWAFAPGGAPWRQLDDLFIVDLCRVPQSPYVVFGTARKKLGQYGGVFCISNSDNTYYEEWLKYDPLVDDDLLNSAVKLVNVVKADRLGKYLYVGTTGFPRNMSEGANWSTGTVLRIEIPEVGVPSQIDILANYGTGTNRNSFQFSENYYHTLGNWDWDDAPGVNETARRMTSVNALAIDPNNPRVVYAGLGVEYFNPSNGVWKCDTTGSWSQVVGQGNNSPQASVTALGIYEGDPLTLYVGSKGEELFRSTITASPYPQISANAEYPILASSTDTTTVIAIEIEDQSGNGISVVTMDASAHAGLDFAAVALADDGVDEDNEAGDGIFTSPKIPANVHPDSSSITVEVFAQDGDGGYSTRAVSVEVVESNTKFVDASVETDDLYDKSTTNPYSSIYFESQSSPSTDQYMVVTFDDALAVPLMLVQTQVTASGAPEFSDSMFDLLGLDPLTSGSRGLSYGDFDSDGDQDIFVCQNSSNARLYRNKIIGEGSAGFDDVTAGFFGADEDSIYQSHIASWGDYNLDGYLDLFVSTLDYSGNVNLLTGGQGYKTYIFRNVGGSQFQKTFSGDSGGADAVLSGVWVDLDADGDVDLVTTQFVSQYLAVYENQGYSEAVGDYYLSEPSIWQTNDFWGATSVNVIDYDHNEYPDLVLTSMVGPGKAAILRNLYDKDDAVPMKEFGTAHTLGVGRNWHGALVADYDMNGQDDIVLLPKDGMPALYMGESTGVPESVATYRDLAYTLGLRAGKTPGGYTSGGVAADFNSDNDTDLYLGRINSDQFFYRNVRQDLPLEDEPDASQKWLNVDLETVGNSNGSLIGTTVVVEAEGRKWTKVVDGGSGRGGQDSNQLLFGLGSLSTATSVSVTVEYPSGDSDFSASVPINSDWTAVEDSPVVLKTGTKQAPEPEFSYELYPGGAHWIFSWKTVDIKGDIRQDVVQVQNHRGYTSGDPCFAGIDPGATEDLTWGRSDVRFKVYWDGAYWQHKVVWLNRACVSGPDCGHQFKVTSGIGNGNTVSSGWTYIDNMDFCIPYDPSGQ